MFRRLPLFCAVLVVPFVLRAQEPSAVPTNRLEEIVVTARKREESLQDIPIAGYAFRATKFLDEVTELMVVVTPHIVNPIPAGETLHYPTDRGPLTNEEIRTKPEPFKPTRPRLPGLGTGGTPPGLP